MADPCTKPNVEPSVGPLRIVFMPITLRMLTRCG
jgi:hypothetical protein